MGPVAGKKESGPGTARALAPKGQQRSDSETRSQPHWRIIEIRLTAEGKRLIANVFPKHAKVVKAEMRAIDGREQESLAGICKEMRIGNFGKFLQEIVMVDPEEMEDLKSGMYRLDEDEG